MVFITTMHLTICCYQISPWHACLIPRLMSDINYSTYTDCYYSVMIMMDHFKDTKIRDMLLHIISLNLDLSGSEQFLIC